MQRVATVTPVCSLKNLQKPHQKNNKPAFIFWKGTLKIRTGLDSITQLLVTGAT